jgi:phosphoribosylamine--glycine ligase
MAQVVEWCQANGIGLVIVGPEAPLVAGLVDDLQQAGIRLVMITWISHISK